MAMLTVKVGRATEPQRGFWASEARHKAFVAGVGSGKTTAGVVEAMRQPKGSTGMVIAPTFPMLRDSTVAKFVELAETAGILTSFNKGDYVATLRGGRTVIFRTGSEPNRLRGPNLAWAWLDEASMLAPAVFKIVLGRLRVAPGRLWVTTSPLGRSNWVFKEFGESRPGRFVIRASTRTNKFLLPGFVEMLEENYDPEFARQEIDGEWIDCEFGQLIAESWLEIAASVLRAAGRAGPRIIGCDPSGGTGRDHAAIVVLDRLGILHLEASKTVDIPHSAQRIALLSRQFEVQGENIVYDGTTGGGGDELPAHLAHHGIRTATRYMGSGSGGTRFAQLRSRMGHRLRQLLDPRRPLPLPPPPPDDGVIRIARAVPPSLVQPPFSIPPPNLGGLWPRLREEMLALRFLDRQDQFWLEPKAAMKARLNRSPDVLDAVLMAISKIDPDKV